MSRTLSFLGLVLGCGLALTAPSAAATLCVNPSGSHGCYSKIQSAVNAATPGSVIHVAAGTYKEQVTVGKRLELIGAGAGHAIIDATNHPHGVLVDGYHHHGLTDVSVIGFTVKNALYEGILVVSAVQVTIGDNHILNNDKIGPAFTGANNGCKGQPAYETDETGDCGGGLHFIGTSYSLVSGNYITGNGDGFLISDETAESRDNLVIHNVVVDNPLECGIVLASHPPVGAMPPAFARHHGVNHNTVTENVSTDNGVKVGGSGVGLFSDGAGQGSVSGNIILRNKLTGNGLGGVALHTHVGPAFGLPADNMSNNQIIGNYISGNLKDSDDTATPGSVGININSGGGGSPVRGTVIDQNVIRDEYDDIAINTPAKVEIHFNDLLGTHYGVADVCAFDKATVCTGQIDAVDNFWGCAGGPGAAGCSKVSGSDIRFTPWLTRDIH